MRKLTLKEMQAVCRGTTPAAGGYRVCTPYGCYEVKPPKPTPTPCTGPYC